MSRLFEEYPRLLDLDPFREDGVDQYNFRTCWTVQNSSATYDREDVAAAIVLCAGNYLDMAKVLRRSRPSVANFVTKDKELFRLREGCKEEFLDMVEKLHMHAALGGDLGAQKFFLTTLGKDRGYISRAETTGKNGVPLMEVPTLTLGALQRLAPEHLEALLTAKDAADAAERLK